MPLQASFKFGDSVIKLNARDAKDFFVQASIFTELPCVCGKCGSGNIGPVHRVVGQEKDEYFNLKCRNPECGALFDVGQRRDGGLFPKDNPDNRTDHVNGWYHYEDQDFGNHGGGNDRQDDRGGRGNGGRDQGRGNQGGGQRQSDRQGAGGGNGYNQPRGNQQGGGQRQQSGRHEEPDESDDIPF